MRCAVFRLLAKSIVKFTTPFPRIEWVPALNAALGQDVMAMNDASLIETGRRMGVEKPETLSRPKTHG
jgi:lysyl-tRNA synthetase class 2